MARVRKTKPLPGEMRIGYLNVGAGCFRNPTDDVNLVVEFIATQALDHHILALSEVHMSEDMSAERRFRHPRTPAHRPGPIDLQLGNHIQARLKETHDYHYVSHFPNALHDFEAVDYPLRYGNVLLIKKGATIKRVEECFLHSSSELNTERKVSDDTYIGRAATRKALIVTFALGDRPVTLLTPHGLYSKQGKVDLPARIAQNGQMAVAMNAHYRLYQRKGECLGIIMGDLNVHSETEAFADLCGRTEIFGNTPGINVNAEYGSTDTRHPEWYPEDKPFREASFALVTNDLRRYEINFIVTHQVPSDHALLTYTLSTLPLRA